MLHGWKKCTHCESLIAIFIHTCSLAYLKGLRNLFDVT